MKRNVTFLGVLGDGFTALARFSWSVFAFAVVQRFIFLVLDFLSSLKIIERNRTANQNGAD